MKIIRRAFLLLASCCLLLHAQPPAAQKDHPSTADSSPLIVDTHPAPYRGIIYPQTNLGHGRFDMKNASVLDLVTFAFDKYDYAVLGGPAWIDFDRFDIALKVSPPAPPKPNPDPAAPPAAPYNPYDAVRPILQRTLAERFHLKYHTEKRLMPGYILTVAPGGIKMSPAKDPDAPYSCRGEQDKSAPTTSTVTCTSFTMERFVRNYGGVYPHLLVDRTGLTKSYDFTLRLSYENIHTRDDYMRIFTDAFKQLGLIVTQADVPQDALVVDSVDRPTPTPHGIAELIPPLPELEFEVATIKPVAQEDNQKMQGAILPRGSQITFNNFNMQGLLVEAFQLKTGAVLGDALPSLQMPRYTITVKLPPEVDARAAFQDRDVVDNMLQKLLADRFGLKYHWATQTQNGYVLLGGTPKMKKADPNSRTLCKYGAPPGEKDFRSSPNSPFDNEGYCQNVTMDQFADMAQAMLGDLVKNRVPNKTGLTGSYDFTIYFTGGRKLRADTAIADAAAKQAGDSAAAPVGGFRADEAIHRQLGLQLVQQPGTYPVLILDHLDQKPTDN